MKTIILYYSIHHQNTKKIIDAVKKTDDSLTTVDITKNLSYDLSSYDLIGFASGIYYNSFAKQMIEFINKNLLENKSVFLIYTHGAPFGFFLRKVRKAIKLKKCKEIGKFHCRGYDTYVFKKFGGIAKNRPNDRDIVKAIEFYNLLKQNFISF